MSVVKTDRSPFFQYDFWVENTRFQGSTKRSDRKGAEKVEAEVRRKALDRIQLGAMEVGSLETLARLWHRLEGSKSTDSRNNLSRVEKLLGSSLVGEKRAGLPPKKMLHELTLADVRKLADARVEEGNAGSTINREIALVQSIIRCAASRGYAVPRLDLSSLKYPENPKLRWFTLEEEHRILAELSPERGRGAHRPILQDQYDLAVFLLDTGARYSEVSKITKDVIDLKRGTATLYRTKVGNEGTLKLTDRLGAVLSRRYSDPALRGPWIFPSRTLSGVSTGKCRGYATSGLRKAIERAGCNEPHLIERFGRATAAHTFRDTFASRLVQAGVSLQEVQLLLGHSSIVQTQKYAHLAPGSPALHAAQVLDSIHAVTNSR